MADIKGAYFPLSPGLGTRAWYRGGLDAGLPASGGTLFKGAPANYKFYPVPIGPQYTYWMRAWNTVITNWEVWSSVGSPNVNPPSGQTVTNVTLIGIRES